jgi:hypothetical protein
VFHDPTVCSQCTVAGCAPTVGKKGHKCQLSASIPLPIRALGVTLLLILFFAAVASAQSSSSCDAKLWKHVYNPQRLKIHDACISVTGTIVDATHGKRKDGLRHEGDGDTHGWLKLDPLFRNLLNAGNKSDEDGNLVFEVICKYRVTQKDAILACRDFPSNIKIPPVGTRVRITGSYVQDQEHAKWMEIHPVTSIEVLKLSKP